MVVRRSDSIGRAPSRAWRVALLILAFATAPSACDTAAPSPRPWEPATSRAGAGGTGGTGDHPFIDAGAILPWPCGNGVADPGEECDDGNGYDADGCSSLCKIEPGATCMPTGPCNRSNGKLDNGEQCDDGNRNSMDGCTNEGTVEPGWVCPLPGKPCRPRCGDGRLTPPETCDDSNTLSDDGCARNCQREPLCATHRKAATDAGGAGGQSGAGAGGESGAPGVSECGAECGDGIVSGDEQCDDGSANLGTYGGCSPDCSYAPYCGDGKIDAGEACDDGANVTLYGLSGCAPGCIAPHFCGDGSIDLAYGELCDQGPSHYSTCLNCLPWTGP